MKNYQLICLLSGNLSEEELNNTQEKTKAFVQENGTIESATIPVKKRFGYKIKGEELGYLVNINFNLDQDKLKILEKKLKSEDKILRYTVLNRKNRKQVLSRRRSPRIFSKPNTNTKIEKQKKVELKEIDKKIEEILGE